jgi:hypothetical protein
VSFIRAEGVGMGEEAVKSAVKLAKTQLSQAVEQVF